MIKRGSLIVWDERTKVHIGALEALNRTLQDLRDSTMLMGGVSVLISGNFRQMQPIIPESTRADQVHACLKSSIL